MYPLKADMTAPFSQWTMIKTFPTEKECHAISRGRFDLGIGKGYAKHEFLGYGFPRKERASRFEEGIDVMRGIWTQDPFSFRGQHYNLQDIRLTPEARAAAAPAALGGRSQSEGGGSRGTTRLPLPRRR